MSAADQAKRAHAIVVELEGLDDYDLTAADLLDALAGCGLRLVPDPGGEAAAAYQQALMDRP